MRLGLSSAAAPDAGIDALVEACARRGLAVLELHAGDAHDVIDAESAAGARACTLGTGVAIGAWWTDAQHDPALLGGIARALQAPVVLADEDAVHERDATSVRDDLARRVALARTLGADAPVLLGVRGPADAWLAAVTDARIDFAWEIDRSVVGPAGDLTRILQAAPGRLRYVRIRGGGPESALQEGQGIGPLMAQLAITGYDGPLVVAPSSSRYRVAWSTWLGRRGGWGCGSKADRSMVSLSADTGEAQ